MNRTAAEVIDEEFLQVRAKLLEVAAFFDRIEVASSVESSEATSSLDKLKLLRSACDLLIDEELDKAPRLQTLFSREYNPDWRSEFDI